MLKYSGRGRWDRKEERDAGAEPGGWELEVAQGRDGTELGRVGWCGGGKWGTKGRKYF